MSNGVFGLKKIALLLALALCLLPASALSEVRRGDHGEEVRYLQWLLQQTGLLNDKPDGSFGPRTEQAVKDYQASKGLEETGVADDALMLALDEDRVRMDQEKYGEDYYQPYPGDYEPEAVAQYGAPAHCRTTVLGDILYRDSCADHLALLEQEYSLTAQGEAAGYFKASELWLTEIQARFDAWAEASAAQREAVEAAREGWIECFQSQYAALYAVYGEPAVPEKQQCLMLKNYAGAMCEFLSGDMPATPSEDFQPQSTGDSGEPFCVQWSINAGTEFVTGCAVHAPLMNREYEWTKAGADDPAALIALMTDWDAALSALYDQWAAASVDTQTALLVEMENSVYQAGDAVRDAQTAFQAAIALQDAALADSGLAPLAHARVVQMECARLCELLNGQG